MRAVRAAVIVPVGPTCCVASSERSSSSATTASPRAAKRIWRPARSASQLPVSCSGTGRSRSRSTSQPQTVFFRVLLISPARTMPLNRSAIWFAPVVSDALRTARSARDVLPPHFSAHRRVRRPLARRAAPGQAANREPRCGDCGNFSRASTFAARNAAFEGSFAEASFPRRRRSRRRGTGDEGRGTGDEGRGTRVAGCGLRVAGCKMCHSRAGGNLESSSSRLGSRLRD